ncbi:MAG: outer membrane beta-barrel protein [Cyclobacteriaceae bacterium]|nr:outer membrane beta-barrel protein [Cyclobacteriaceae bacterium]
MTVTRSVFLSVFLLFASLVSAQRSEVGFGIGTFNYTGDLARNYQVKNLKPAGTVYYRSNISKVVSFRATITAGQLGAKETPIDAFAATRNASFNTFLLETSLGFEYHFLDWRDVKRPMRYTPYLFAGLGLFGISGYDVKPEEYSNVQLTIPFGGGFKYIINPKHYIALEVGIRKTFFDYLDNLSDGDQTRKNYQYGNPNDFDNYFFVGITLTRTFYDIPCPKNPYK